MADHIDVWGPSTGSSRIRLHVDAYKRLRVLATTDFGEANCGFNKAGAIKLHEAIGELIKQL